MKVTSLTIPPKKDERILSIENPVSHRRRRNGKATSHATMGFTGHWCEIYFGPEKKPLSFGQLGTRHLLSTSGEPALHRCLSPNNVCFASLILASQLSISFGIASKLGGCGDGPPLLCMNFAGLIRTSNFDNSIGKKTLFGE